MASTASRPLAALLTAVLVAALLGLGAQAAVSAPALPEVAADELIASVLRTAEDPPPVSGELAATLGLGLPELPGAAQDSPLADLLGESRLRVERSADGLRAALLGAASERVVVTDGDTLSTWDSQTLAVNRWTLPDELGTDGTGSGGTAPGHGPLAFSDPLALAIPLVESLSEGADVAVEGTARVAGRPAYRLAVVPADLVTTLGRVELDVDADTRVPLRVALYARGAVAPSIELAWTQVSFAPVDPALFDFTPPPGSVVTEHAAPVPWSKDSGKSGLPGMLNPGPAAGPSGGDHGGEGIGAGYSAVAVLPLATELPSEAQALLPLDGPLLSARVATVRGQSALLLGLVPLWRLDEVAAELP